MRQYLDLLKHVHDHGTKNYYTYRDTEGDQEWELLPWDKDLVFGKTWDGGLGMYDDSITANDPVFYIEWNKFYDLIYDIPETRAMYVRRLRTLMDEFLQPTQTSLASCRRCVIRYILYPVNHSASAYIMGKLQHLPA